MIDSVVGAGMLFIIASLILFFVIFMISKGIKKAREEIADATRYADMVRRSFDHIEKGHFQTPEEKAENQRINELGREKWGKY